MKTFDELNFEPHPVGVGGRWAKEEFNNGYGVSVIIGTMFYSDGVSTYEVAVTKEGVLCYDTPITSDVIGRQTTKQVTEIMRKVQALQSSKTQKRDSDEK